MADNKTFYGQPYIFEDSLIQDITEFTDKGSSESNKILISDIWNYLKTTKLSEDSVVPTKDKVILKSDKTKTYFYWEIKISSLDVENEFVSIKIDCPIPSIEIFTSYKTKIKDGKTIFVLDSNEDKIIEKYDLDVKTSDIDWTKYWKNKFKEVESRNYNSKNGLQQKEVILSESKYIGQDGNEKILPSKTIIRSDSDLGDIQNLLCSIF